MQTFYSHGKLLLTAEYLVLDGATALALPTQKGQWLNISFQDTPNQIVWRSLSEDGICWFETILEQKDNSLKPLSENGKNDIITQTLINILSAAQQLNPNFLSSDKGYIAESKLEFHRKWGLGSSSTLINNIAQWAQVDAFALLDISFGGSGYDIACAQNDTPILYKRHKGKPSVSTITFNPSFKENLFFIYLNQKQDSKASIKHYKSLPVEDLDIAKKEIQKITSNILSCTALREFNSLIDNHEKIISNIIQTPTIKSSLFADYQGSIKSLGGWGGDFILVTGNSSDMSYFENKGYNTIIPYTEMILF